MKILMVGLSLILLVGCSRQPIAPRWAIASKHEIDMEVFKWSREKMDTAKAADGLTPEIEEQISTYEKLQRVLTEKDMERRGYGAMRRPPGMPEPAEAKEDYQTLSNRVATMRVPIAAVLERRSRQAAKLRDEFSTEKLIAEYAKGRFDLVVDVDPSFARGNVLYREAPETLNITDGVIDLFKKKASLAKD
jgi:hypothetical protein